MMTNHLSQQSLADLKVQELTNGLGGEPCIPWEKEQDATLLDVFNFNVSLFETDILASPQRSPQRMICVDQEFENDRHLIYAVFW